MADKNTLDLARQWAADIDADRQTLSQDTIDAAADLISSLPDAWVDAKELREVLAWAEQAENRAHADWIRTADTHHRDAALAYTQAVTWLRYALGDNDG